MEPGSLRAATAAATVQQMTDTLAKSPSNLSSSTDEPAQTDLNGVGSSEDSLGGKWSSEDRLSHPPSATTLSTTSTASAKTSSKKSLEEDGAFLMEEGSDPPVRQPEVIPITGRDLWDVACVVTATSPLPHHHWNLTPCLTNAVN
ncbi:hypothetical protein E2C01_064347 [Portunus trituberculatus]|uniref:Uncharacterized protein n=1 Tax=Portunus trituberculatus TaxID=210409 RepID=A0A5B7HMZ3_PORTR|nr:hypothetical protein [Portunus trituberculatus]